MESSSFHSIIDYFKLFKVFDLKKLQKTGVVKLVQDQQLNRKVLSVEGSISTANYIIFPTANYPNIQFSQRYLYLQATADSGKSFCIQLSYTIGSKQYKAVYSTLYKVPKKHLENIVHLPISIVPEKWNIAVIDLFELGMHFGLKPQQMKLIFRITAVEIRASSKVKGIFQANYLFSVDRMPKEMQLPLKKDENFFDKFHYFVVSSDQTLLKEISGQEYSQKQILQSKKEEMPIRKESKKHEKSQSKETIKNASRLSADKTGHKEEGGRIKEKVKNQKSQEKAKKQKSPSQHSRVPNHRPPIPQTTKQKPTKDHPQIEQEEEIEPQEHEMVAPQPQGTISMALSCIQGFTLNRGTVSTIQSYLFKPVFMPTHKPIQMICQVDPHNVRVLTAYNDGSICLWDAIRKQPLNYFMTELQQIKQLLIDESMTLVILGLDKMKREVINIVSNNSVIFRQISNFNIHGALLVSRHTFEEGLLSFGFENIRLWRVNSQKNIIQGSSIYLGQTNRKVKYTSAIMVKSLQDNLAFITDSNGFITTLSISQAKMLQSLKIDQHAIDHIIQLKDYADPRALISNQYGVLKILNLQSMQILEELNINSRIKEMQIIPDSPQIILTHYNKSIGSINLDSGLYSFLMRSHTAPITKLLYNVHYNKVLSMSKDTSIRIWQYVTNSDSSLPFRLQQQYQFLITGEEMIDAVCPLEGSSEDSKLIVVASDSGKLRRIDIESYSIRQEVLIEAGKMAISMSRNGKYVLVTYSSGNSYLLDDRLSIIAKYMLGRGEKKKVKNWRNGFNKYSKEYFIQHFEEERLEFYSLKNIKEPLFFISNKDVSSIEAVNENIFIVGSSELKIYERNSLQQVVNYEQTQIASMIDPKTHAFCYPVLCYAQEDKVKVRVLLTSYSEEVELPEHVNNLTISHDYDKQEGLIFCSGVSSFALYVISYQLHNIFYDLSSTPNVSYQAFNSRVQMQDEDSVHRDELQISFSKTTLSAFTNKPLKKNKIPSQVEEFPKELKKLYGQEEQLYEEVKEYLFPKSFQESSNNKQEQQQVESTPNYFEFNQNQKEGINILLQYGYETRQDALADKDVGSFHWLSQNNSMLLLTGSGKDILQHFFTVPIKHKVLNFPSVITSISVSRKAYEGLKYLAICVNCLIKIYNAYEQLSYIRTIDSLANTLPTNVIFQSSITNCNRFLLVLSYNNIQFDFKIYIHLIEISSGNVVTSSYLSLPSPKNKYKNTQIKEVREYRLKINPFKNILEFIIFNPQGIFHFYRITSILTLQTIQLEQLIPLCRDKVNDLTSASFISVGDQTFEDSVIALGSQNGSVVFVDTRTANIMIACVGLVPNTPITCISFAKSNEESGSKLVLFTNTTNIVVYNLHQGINSILASMQPQNPSKVSQQSSSPQVKQLMTLDGQVVSCSTIENSCQQLVISKCGTLWMLDYQDLITVKVSSIHTKPINKAEIVALNSTETVLFTCSDDGCLKISNLINLQQSLQIFKPRKQAKTFNLHGSFILVSFGQEIFIYSQLSQESPEMVALGSFKLDQLVIDIQNIPYTDNYFILTETELVIAFLQTREVKNKSQLTLRSISMLSQHTNLSSKQIQVQVQLQKITDVQNPFKVEVNNEFAPHDQFALLSKPGKSTIWSRKCLKRNSNPIEELANVHELSYYLIDSTSRNSTEDTYLKFVSQTQYVWGLLEEGLIQVRNYREHAIVREINISVTNLSSLLCLGNEQFTFVAGDQQGNLYVLNENGLLIERIKALQCPIRGIAVWENESRKRLVVNGDKYVVIVANPGIK